jgi:MFS family permease
MNRDTFLVLLAFAMDGCAGLIGLCVPLVGARIGADYGALGAIGACGSVAYTVGCLFTGRLADRIGYRQVMTLASLGSLLVFGAYLAVAEVWHLFVIAVVGGLATSGFWPSLQAWLGQGHDRRGLLRAVGRFNVAWSLGFLVGPALGGYLYAAVPAYVFVAAAGCVTVILLALLAAPVREPSRGVTGATDATPAAARRFLPVAWVANFATFFASGTVRSLFPKFATEEVGVAPETLGWLVSLIGLAQALAFLAFAVNDRWQFRLGPLVAVQALAAVGLTSLAWGASPTAFAAGLLVQGLLVGATFTASIFYSLHAEGPGGRRTGLHEAIVGSGFLAGPLVGGFVADAWGPRSPYLVAAAVVAAATLVEAAMLWRGRASLPAPNA